MTQKRIFRKKRAGGSSEDGSVAPDVNISTHDLQKIPKPKKRRKKAKEKRAKSSLLSFGDETEEVDQVGRVRADNPAVAKKRRARAPPLRERELPLAAASSSGMYSAEALKELQQSSFKYGGGHVPVSKPEGGHAPVTVGPCRTDDSNIPSADEIYAARQTRELARQQADFIALNDSGNQVAGISDDDDGIDELNGGMDSSRVLLRGTSLGSSGKRAEVQAALQDGSDFYGGDSELRHIEAQNVRNASRTGVNSQMRSRNTLNIRDTSRQSEGGLYGIGRHRSRLSTVSIDDICGKMHRALSHQQDAKAKHERDLVTISQTERLASDAVVNIEKKLSSLEPRYRYYQELWHFVDNMTACIDSKLPDILECEAQLLELERSAAVGERAWLVLEDLASEVSGDVSQPQLRRSESPCLDEFGRDRSDATAKAQEGAAVMRRQQFDSLLETLRPTDSGCVSDDEIEYVAICDSEIERICREKADVIAAGSALFCDADPEFSSVEAIAKMMEQWKRQQPTSYCDTYVSLNLVKVFAPFVRLDMLSWQPDDGCVEAFSTQSWFTALESYGEKLESPGTNEAQRDTDEDLIPSLVEKAVVPRLLNWVEVSWNPLSTKSTDTIFTCVQEVSEVFVTVDKKAMSELLHSIMVRLQQTAGRFQIPKLAACVPCASEKQRSALNHLFLRGVKFVENTLRWCKQLAISPLEQLLEQIVGNKICPVLICPLSIPLENSGTEWLPKIERLIRVFPPEWLAQTQGLRHIVRAAATANTRVLALNEEELIKHKKLVNLLP